ncbi:MAG: tetratricopeptide repeat protein [Parachlamydiales bacterium]|nr:tetratricopeptide repeat protein [Parachlamydiales bacterium]
MDWKSYLELSDDTLDDIRLVGYSYIKQGCFDIALDFFNALVILNPNSSYDQQTLGAIYMQKGRYLDSLKHFDQALKIEPKNYFIMLNRAKSLFSLGYIKEGLMQANELQKCLDKNISTQAKALIEAYS